MLGPNARRAIAKDIVLVFEDGNASDVVVGVEEVVVARVTETLMPKHAFSGSLDGMDGGVSLDVLMERQTM